MEDVAAVGTTSGVAVFEGATVGGGSDSGVDVGVDAGAVDTHPTVNKQTINKMFLYRFIVIPSS